MGKCRRCGRDAGFLSTYCGLCYEKDMREKEEKKQRVKDGKAFMYDVLESYEDDEFDYKTAYSEIINYIDDNDDFAEYLESSIDSRELLPNERIIYKTSSIDVIERKNSCKMERTGYSYERYPIWDVRDTKISNSNTILISNMRIYLYTTTGLRLYPLNKIVNAGSYSDTMAFFDVKTTSPYPHRFIIQGNSYKAEDVKKLANLLEIVFKMTYAPNFAIGKDASKKTSASGNSRRETHKWTYEENLTCCQAVIDNFVTHEIDFQFDEFLDELNKLIPEVKRNSLKMKIQNIKSLLIEYDIPNTLNTKPLTSCSRDNRKAFEECIEEIDFDEL